MAVKLYGNNKVFFKGRFISGPDVRSCWMSLLMILVPSVLWHVETGLFFAKRYSLLVPIFGAIWQIGAMGMLLATAFSDPGIMPRAPDHAEQYDVRTKSFRTKQPPRYFDLVLRGHPFKLKYCTTCNIYRPPRCTHCSVCENCIERFDHHCPWIGNCIGRRNYWLFYSFVSFTGSMNVFVMVTSVAHLTLLCVEYRLDGFSGGDSLVHALRQAPITAAVLIYAIVIIWFTVGLCMYHNYLVATNQTTYEQIKGIHNSGVFSAPSNPFHLGFAGNFFDIICGRVRPRYFNAHSGQLFWPKGASDSGYKQPGDEKPENEPRPEGDPADGYSPAKESPVPYPQSSDKAMRVSEPRAPADDSVQGLAPVAQAAERSPVNVEIQEGGRSPARLDEAL